jgi:hypothetical protein
MALERDYDDSALNSSSASASVRAAGLRRRAIGR